MIRLSTDAKERYGIEAEAYLDLHRKYQEGVRHMIDVRALGNILYKGLLSASALAAAIGTLNIFSFVADQRGKSIAASWNTLNQYKGEPIDGGRKSAIESLVGFGEILYNVDLSTAPLIRLDARPSCAFLSILPAGTFGINWRQRNFSRETHNCLRAELQNATFNGSWIYEADLSRANLSEAKFNQDSKGDVVRAQGINLSHATLIKAKLIGANLSPSSSRSSDLHNADLRRASLEGINLTGANLRDADLRGANLRGATLQGVKLCRTRIQVNGEASKRTIGYEALQTMQPQCIDQHGRAVDGKPLLFD